ncbi:MAG: O-succinylhomoserine sulfhydrylase [Albidovulum sp.]|nr:O-succinylhomoserine sulfhydrylase [Albidovulum sp.]
MQHRRRTRSVHAGIKRSQFGENAEAIFLTQGFVYDSAEQAEARFVESGPDEYIYARYGNPTVRMFEERMASLEGAEDAFATASGMAAVYAALASVLSFGDHVVSSRALFGSCLYILENILPRFGIEVTFVDGTDASQWRRAIRADTKAVFLESISNPMLEVIDLTAVCELARSVGAIVVVDNVLATPVFHRCKKMGADVVVYSTTKHIDGQGRCLGGIVLGQTEFIRKTLEPFLKHTGGAISPFNAWVMLKGLETLELRCNAQADSAANIATGLRNHPKLSRVIYPFLPDHPQFKLAEAQLTRGGTVFSIEFSGGKEAAFRFLNALRIVRISNNLGDTKSLCTHPSTTTHQRLSSDQRKELGITEGIVRISIGLEDVRDLSRDIESALDAV